MSDKERCRINRKRERGEKEIREAFKPAFHKICEGLRNDQTGGLRRTYSENPRQQKQMFLFTLAMVVCRVCLTRFWCDNGAKRMSAIM